MARRFTLAGLLLWVTFVCLALAFVVPRWRHFKRQNAHVDRVVSIAASADGSTFAAVMGDRRVLVWDSAGNLKTQLEPPATVGGTLKLSFDGKLLAFSRGWFGDSGHLVEICSRLARRSARRIDACTASTTV